jgi:hypothetical protein
LTAAMAEFVDNFTIAMPNGRLVPWGKTDFTVAGWMIGLAIRGFPLFVNFAPLVWSFIAGKTITNSEVLDTDPNLRSLCDRLRTGHDRIWLMRDWDGISVIVPGKTGSQLADTEIEMFISEYIAMRTAALVPALRQMKRGFRKCAGLKGHQFLNGELLEAMARGDEVTRQTLRAVVRLGSGVRSDLFWAAVAQMNEREMVVLLRKTTGLERVPMRDLFPEFRIELVGKAGDEVGLADGRIEIPPNEDEEAVIQSVLAAVRKE